MLSVYCSTTYFSACKPDQCKNRATVCANGGTCVDGDCVCAVGYEGDSCQFRVNDKFDGVYACIRTRLTNADTISEGADDTLHVKALGDKFKIQFNSIRDSVYEVIQATVTGNYVTIPEQQIDFPLFKAQYSGYGSLNSGVLTLTLFRTWDLAGINTSKTTYVGYIFEP